MNPEELGELFEGDIAGIAGEARNGLIDEKYRWPNGVVPYEITPGDFSKPICRNLSERVSELHNRSRRRDRGDHDLDAVLLRLHERVHRVGAEDK